MGNLTKIKTNNRFHIFYYSDYYILFSTIFDERKMNERSKIELSDKITKITNESRFLNIDLEKNSAEINKLKMDLELQLKLKESLEL
jgi:hypothetical protein